MDENPVPPFNSRPRLDTTGPSRNLRDLPDSLLCAVLAQVSEIGGGFTHSLVCRKWAHVSMETQSRVVVREDACIADSELLINLRDFSNLRELELKKKSALRLTNRFFLGIGATCPRLESIIILEASSSLIAEFSTEGLRGMISSLPGLKTFVLGVDSSKAWDVPDSVTSLRSLKVLLVEPRWKSQPSFLTIPPSIRKLGFCSKDWVVTKEEGGLQGVRVLIIEVTDTQEIPEVLWTACSLRSLRMYIGEDCPHLGAFVSRLTALRQLQLQIDGVIDLSDCFSTLQSLTQLRLSSRDAESLPDSLWSFTSLKSLYLDCSKLRSINSGVGRLLSLTNLHVFSRQEHDFTSSLCGHSALCKLDLYLPNVQPGVELRARALTDANIWLNKQTDLRRFLRGCLALSSLSVNHVKDASSLLGDGGLLPSLQNLKIWGPSTLQQALPNFLGCYSSLETLEIDGWDGIVELPSSIAECRRLTKLRVETCENLRNLPQRLGSLGNLRTLRIEGCPELQCLPRSVGQLSSLEHLELDSLDKLKSIPNSLGAARWLCTLRISSCTMLNRLPESVGQLALLTSLSVQYCPLLEELPASTSQLLSLRVLDLSGLSALQSLPMGVEKITTLQSLIVQECTSLLELPSELGQLKNLRMVVIEDCHTLRQIPPSIGDLLHLKRLHLKDLSSLPSIPPQIGQLSSLRDLLIQNLPSLTSLPDSMTRLTGLAELSIEDCDSLAWVPELLERLLEISDESKKGLRYLMETGALRGVQQRRSRHARRTREGVVELGAGGMT